MHNNTDKREEIISKLNVFLENSNLDIVQKKKFTPGAIFDSEEKLDITPQRLKYPAIHGEAGNDLIIINFSIRTSMYDTISGNPDGRITLHLDDFLIPYLNIRINYDIKKHFAIKERPISIFDKILEFLKIKKPYLFYDTELDSKYFIEPKYYLKELHNIGKTILPYVKALPAFHSLYFHENIVISIPLESIDLNNNYFINNVISNLSNIKEKFITEINLIVDR